MQKEIRPICSCKEGKCKGNNLLRSGAPGHSGPPGNVELHEITREYDKKRDALLNELYWLEVEYYRVACKHNRDS